MGNLGAILFGLFFIVLGIGLVFNINVWNYFFPALLILIGLSILFSRMGISTRSTSNWQSNTTPQETHESTLDYAVVFSEADKKVVTNDFKGGKISSVFGGMTLDLRSAKIAKNHTVSLEASAVFGGIKIIVPKSWRVDGSLTGVFGGFSNNTVVPEKPEGTLMIKGSGVFGGGEIVN